ncbi:MAG: class D sortase [Anaerolineae bacterium]
MPMRDKRPVDELSIEELERILAIRKREERARLSQTARIKRYSEQGRVLPVDANLEFEAEAEIIEGDYVDQDDAQIVDIADQADQAPAISAPALPAAQPANGADLPVEIEDKPVAPTYFEGDPRFEDEQPRAKPQKQREREGTSRVRQRVETKRHQPLPHTTGKLGASSSANAASAPVVLTPRQKLWNRVLLGVEIAAVLGLVGLGFILYQSVIAVQEQSAREQAIAQATAFAAIVPPTATPIINVPVVVLPGGHVYEGNGQGSFNFDEIPAQFRTQYANYLSQLPVARPTAQPEGPIRIRIPAINVDSNVVYGDDPEALDQGVGHHIGSANPGQQGNMVLSAHNDIAGEIFRYLDQLQSGDEVIVSTVSRDYVYVIQESQKVSPNDVWVLEAQGTSQRLTLISCWPYRVNNKRIVVFATLRG